MKDPFEVSQERMLGTVDLSMAPKALVVQHARRNAEAKTHQPAQKRRPWWAFWRKIRPPTKT